MALTKASTEVIDEFMRTNGDQIGYVIIKPTQEVWETYSEGVTGGPYAYLINSDGIIVWKGNPAEIDDFLTRAMDESIIDQSASGKH